MLVLPGQRPVFEDGSSSYPFRSIKKAIDKGKAGKYCTISLKLTKGIFSFDAGMNTSNLTIVGTERDGTIIRDGIFSNGSVTLKLENLTLSGEASHLLQVNGGELDLKKVRVLGYRFRPDLINRKPFAIGLNNTKANIVGLEILDSTQPAIRIDGTKARVKATLVSVHNTHALPPDTNEIPVPYRAAIEITNGAIANFLITDVHDVDYSGIMVSMSASLYAAQIATYSVKKTHSTIASGVYGYNAKVVQVNGFWSRYSQAGMTAFKTPFTLQNGVITKNQWGFVSYNNDINNDQYDTYKCVTQMNVSLVGNLVVPGLISGWDDLPVPNEPMPVPPPFDPKNPAPPHPPMPPQAELPLPICPKAERL
jgi:hypothetical protein